MSAALSIVSSAEEDLKRDSRTCTDAENLARHIISRMESVTAKLKSLEDDIRKLWAEFDKLKAGETILGCATKKEFCERKLNRTPRAIQYLLSGRESQASPEPSEQSSRPLRPSDIPAPRPTEISLEDALDKRLTKVLGHPPTPADYARVEDICRRGERGELDKLPTPPEPPPAPSMPAEPEPQPNLFDAFWKKVNVLREYSGDGCEHVFVQLALDVQKEAITTYSDYQTVELIVAALRQSSKNFLEYAKGLERVMAKSPAEFKRRSDASAKACRNPKPARKKVSR